MQSEVKRFLRDPNHGRLLTSFSPPVDTIVPGEDPSDIESHPPADKETIEKKTSRQPAKGHEVSSGKVVDVVLSDMSEPWPLETPSWKRSLSDPYIRMMNTSGINYKDHAGSMV